MIIGFRTKTFCNPKLIEGLSINSYQEGQFFINARFVSGHKEDIEGLFSSASNAEIRVKQIMQNW